MPTIADLIAVPVQPGDREQLAAFHRRCVEFAAEASAVSHVLDRLARADVVPDSGWPAGTALAAADSARAAMGTGDPTFIAGYLERLLALL